MHLLDMLSCRLCNSWALCGRPITTLWRYRPVAWGRGRTSENGGHAMPHSRLFPAAVRQLRSQLALAPPTGRLVGLMLCALGLACGRLPPAPMLAGAQSASLTIVHDPGVRAGPPRPGGPTAPPPANERAPFA